jgi:hypothetical protein
MPQLETLAQAEAENLRRIDALADRAPDIAAALEACDRKARCGCNTFDEFLFLFGAKRRGGRIVVER